MYFFIYFRSASKQFTVQTKLTNKHVTICLNLHLLVSERKYLVSSINYSFLLNHITNREYERQNATNQYPLFAPGLLYQGFVCHENKLLSTFIIILPLWPLMTNVHFMNYWVLSIEILISVINYPSILSLGLKTNLQGNAKNLQLLGY